ncbi:uncharacterized protein RCC_11124 [Ramularia collo-cygni]|uniref:UBA domain-containing protein n=1 Tax=Ramularia collo-cygni TaxID=112498 RepID=A0A2D3VBD0_9PEZI|nr:uncharacterized protein RCC_11124 [Ramularia collo-cygni]CZT25393.1 uncharacterized protein RCC_11124 [Ramularia collo-cygni]
MKEACAASIDAVTTCTPSDDEQGHNAVNIARRSMSIFSRRGTMTPEPPAFAPLESVATPKQMSEKQRNWLLRKSGSRDGPISLKNARLKSRRGTVLRAVPPANVTRLSALEEEMAHSPNEEILSAIGEHPPTGRPPVSPSFSQSTTSQEKPGHIPLSKRSSRRDASSRIGVWVDGVVYWNEAETATPKPIPDPKHLSHVQCNIARKPTIRRKPLLSVVIPNGGLGPSDRKIHQPQPRRPQSKVIPPLDRPRAPLRQWSPDQCFKASSWDSQSRGTLFGEVTVPKVGKPTSVRQDAEPQVSRSSTSSSSIGENTSTYSNRSSATSIEGLVNTDAKYVCKLDGKLDISRGFPTGLQSCHTPPVPNRAPPDPPALQDRPVQSTGNTAPTIRLLHPHDTFSSSLHTHKVDEASPTWSQAEEDLQHELCATAGEHDNVEAPTNTMAFQGLIRRSGSVREVMEPPCRAPTIPKRSRKRDWTTHISYPASELQRRQSESQQKGSGLSQNVGVLRKSVSVSCCANPISATRQSMPSPPGRSTKRLLPNCVAVGNGNDLKSSRREAIAAAMTSTVTSEDVLLHILSRLHSPQDLFHTAIINKGMYRVFQENQIHLLRTVVFNESPASWELREWTAPDGDEPTSSSTLSRMEHSALSYMRCYRRDTVVVQRLSRLVFETCQGFLRRETVVALSTPSHPDAPRFNDAFWRIWTFCQIFGGARNREDDITGQMDWLKGGVLANNEDCIASTEPNMEFDLRSVLISAPPYFAESNRGGLSASQLFDMTEIWTCMTALLQGYHGCVRQARYYGVFDRCEVPEGDIKDEETMLEEWTTYLMTLGPRVVLEMAQVYPAAGFALARENGWTRWTPPIHNGSRASFLKEPVAKSYEEQIIVATQQQQDPREQVRKDANRRRVATLAAEIRVRRQSSAYKRSPLIDMKNERAMSVISRRDSVSPTRAYHSREASQRTSAASRPVLANPRSTENTSERAIQQLVTMGFERDLAVDALRITDRGDGLRPDRAIDLLLRQQEE